ncbi:PTS sugar transporter subunit IIA [Corynebacterium jeikeium]|uniref:Putative PTS system IIabc component n=1 Tax=Corynebacterium jeikeium (strain K411) TaxID=306537 RepID=Q4JXU9_CORJK|nr:PTS glucose transporter subunit IIA [Corynebacterium jeikeium]CAI36358.1 putative PTS system IIabc component [Corynebacterium jeikeium K411]
MDPNFSLDPRRPGQQRELVAQNHSAKFPVVTPLAGTAVSLDSVPDPILATGTIGAGVAVIPDAGVEVVQILAPIGGVMKRVAPNMFVIQTHPVPGDSHAEVLADQPSIFMQLGVDTGRLNGQGFDVHVQEGDLVRQGAPVCTYAPRELGRMGFDPVVMVLGLQMGASEIKLDVFSGEPVMGGDNLFWV